MSSALVAFLSHISIVIWVFLLFLVLLFTFAVGAMLYNQICLRRRLDLFANSLKQLAKEGPKNRTHGLSLAYLDTMRVSLENLEGLPKEWWSRVNRSISLYINENDEDGWFITELAGELLPYDLVVRQNFHTAQYSAIPGILTGLGLTGTFIAILIALYGVHYDELNTVKPVTGMAGLINGLSGKFFCSIIALFFGIIFTVFDKQIVRSLQRSYQAMIAVVTDAIPYLPTSRILLDIHRFAASVQRLLTCLKLDLGRRDR